MKTTDRVMGKIAIPVIMVAGLLLIAAMISSARGTSKENNAYIRVINCIVSHNVGGRTQEDIKRCYMTVENDLQIDLKRYDSSN